MGAFEEGSEDWKGGKWKIGMMEDWNDERTKICPILDTVNLFILKIVVWTAEVERDEGV